MAQYTVRPTSVIDTSYWGAPEYTTNSGSSWATASNANVLSAVSDNSDLTGVRSGNGGTPRFMFACGVPALASDEFICRVGAFARWSGGVSGKYLGVQALKVPYSWTGYLSNIATDGRSTLTTTEPGYVSSGWENDDGTDLGMHLQFDGDIASNRPRVWDVGLTVYAMKRATATPQATTMTGSTYPTIPVDTTATIDWEATAADTTKLRTVTVEIRIESGGTGVGTGTLVSSVTKDQLFSSTGTVTVSVSSPDSLPNGTYKVYARAIRHRENETSVASDQIGAWSSSATLTMQVTPPLQPTISTTFEDANARVAIGVTPNASSGYSTPYVSVERSDDGGASWVAVRSGTAIAATFGTATTVYDYEAPRASAVQYRARVSAYTAGGVMNTSGVSASPAITIPVSGWNLKCPQAPNLNATSVIVTGKPTENVSEDLGVFRPDGRRYPIVVAGTLSGWDGELEVACSSAVEWERLKALVEAGAVLFLESGFGWSKYVRLIGGIKVTMMGTATAQRRMVTLSYVETSRPADVALPLAAEIEIVTDGGAAATASWAETWDGGAASTTVFALSFDGGSAS